jgi:hypothetical protein
MGFDDIMSSDRASSRCLVIDWYRTGAGEARIAGPGFRSRDKPCGVRAKRGGLNGDVKGLGA